MSVWVGFFNGFVTNGFYFLRHQCSNDATVEGVKISKNLTTWIMNDPIVEYITEKHPDRDTLMLKSPHKVSEKGIGIKLSTEHTEKPYFSYYKSP